MKTNRVICDDCVDRMRRFPDNSFDGIVTDPPYGLGFMGKEWDTFKQENVSKPKTHKLTYKTDYKDGIPVKRAKPELVTRDSGARRAGSYDLSRNAEFQQWFTIWAAEALRIVKPGAIMLIFGGTRTYHRLMCAIEDAGWQIRDCMMWLYGSGFPKSHNISKAIDKAKGAERKTTRIRTDGNKGGGAKTYDDDSYVWDKPFAETAAATDLAKLWDGYGTALKPAWEPIIVAMKPLDGTFAANAEKWGVAGLNIDGGRIGTEDNLDGGAYSRGKQSDDKWGTMHNYTGKGYKQPQGRWPANLILGCSCVCKTCGESGFIPENQGHNNVVNIPCPDCKSKHEPDCPVRMLDEQSGVSKSLGKRRGEISQNSISRGKISLNASTEGIAHIDYSDSGGASRFFYTAKASGTERENGLKGYLPCIKCGQLDTDFHIDDKGNEVKCTRNNHPTVKPLALMEYLCKLLRPPTEHPVLLDPFTGSGTTLIAALNTDWQFIGIEKEPDYCKIARARIKVPLIRYRVRMTRAGKKTGKK